MVGIVEIPLQIDKYFMYHEADAALGAVAGINVSFTTLALILLYGLWIMQIAQSEARLRLRLIMGVPMLFYIGTVVLSSLSATLPMLSYFDVSLLLQAYGLFFFIANRVQTKVDLMICALALATTLFIQALLIFGLKALHVDNQEINIGPLVLIVWEGERHGGTMQSPVLAGSTMALIWLPLVALLLCRIPKLLWLFFALATACGLIAILLTQTRGAILTSAVGCMIIGLGMLFRGWLPRWTMIAACIMALLSLYPLYVVYKKRIEHGDGDSAIARKHLSLIALDMIQDRPFFGHGAGNCHLAGKPYADNSKYRSEWYYTIHSKYLLVWVETGLLGLIGFLCVLGNGVRQGLSAWFRRDPLLAPLGLALTAALAGHSLHMAVDIFNSRTQVEMLWVILGMLAATYRLAEHFAATQSQTSALAGSDPSHHDRSHRLGAAQ